MRSGFFDACSLVLKVMCSGLCILSPEFSLLLFGCMWLCGFCSVVVVLVHSIALHVMGMLSSAGHWELAKLLGATALIAQCT